MVFKRGGEGRCGGEAAEGADGSEMSAFEVVSDLGSGDGY